MIKLLSAAGIINIRKSAQILSDLLQELSDGIKPGVSGLDLDEIAIKFMEERNVLSNFKGYRGFRNNICVSVNEALIHGIPNDIPFKNGDVVSIDAGCIYKKLHSDAAFTKIVGSSPDPAAVHLVEVTKESLLKVTHHIKHGIRVGTIGSIIEKFVTKKGLFLNDKFSGHGIGEEMHMDPSIPNVGVEDTGLRLCEGMVICIEPMVQQKSSKIMVQKDGWTIASVDEGLCAHYEAMILITRDGCELLTKII